MNIADVAGALLVVRWRHAEVAAVIPARVESDDFMTGSLEKRDDHSAEIAAISRNKNTHWPPAK